MIDDLSDPVFSKGRDIAQLIKATLGITALSRLRVHIDDEDCDIDVGLLYPRGEVASKGWVVRSLK